MWISTLKPLLSKEKKILLETTSAACYASDGKQIASIACIDPKLINLVRKGLEEFSSLTAHKLLRWQIKTGFESWIEQRQDPRLICTTGGYEGIAELIGCGGSHKAITTVKALLHAQAYAQFSFYDGSYGNMIILREVERYRNKEPSKINIILGEFLLPNYTQLLPKGEKRRLIPIPILPPLIGSNNTHAAQALLQLLVLEEFSDQSKDFIDTRCLRLSRDQWAVLAESSGLPQSSLDRVLAGWIERDFLQKSSSHKDGYVLGESHFQLMDFLQQQGEGRKEGEKAATKSVVMQKARRQRSHR